jgi:hypothetical protein
MVLTVVEMATVYISNGQEFLIRNCRKTKVYLKYLNFLVKIMNTLKIVLGIVFLLIAILLTLSIFMPTFGMTAEDEIKGKFVLLIFDVIFIILSWFTLKKFIN